MSPPKPRRPSAAATISALSTPWIASATPAADIATNAILLRAERDLLNLARRFGSAAERSDITTRVDRISTAIARLWSDQCNPYLSRDLVAGTPSTSQPPPASSLFTAAASHTTAHP